MRAYLQALFLGAVLWGCASQPTAPESNPSSQDARTAILGTQERVETWVKSLSDAEGSDSSGLYASDAQITLMNDRSGNQDTSNPKAWRAFLRTAFPDLKAETQLSVHSGQHTAVVLRYSGTHKDSFMGVPATNKTVSVLGAAELEWDSEGRIKRETHYLNPMNFAAQLGVGPEPHPVPEVGWSPSTSVRREGTAEEAAMEAALDEAQAIIDRRQTEGIVSFAKDDMSFHDRFNGQFDHAGAEALQANIATMFKVSEDAKQEHENYGAGSWLVHKVHTTGTLTGDAPEMGLKANGKRFDFRSLEFFRFEDGKAKDMWFFGNGLAFAQQLGLVPDSAAAGQ